MVLNGDCDLLGIHTNFNTILDINYTCREYLSKFFGHVGGSTARPNAGSISLVNLQAPSTAPERVFSRITRQRHLGVVRHAYFPLVSILMAADFAHRSFKDILIE